MILGVLESAKVSPERIFELGNFGRRKILVRADENFVFLALRLENFDFFKKDLMEIRMLRRCAARFWRYFSIPRHDFRFECVR